MFEIKNILVPVDFSECSRAAYARAMALGDQLGSRVTLYHVAALPPTSSASKIASERTDSTLGEQALANAKNELEAFLGQVSPTWRSKAEVRVSAGNPRDCILKEAAHGDYDLLVMGTHGRTGRAHALAGSVAESVVRAARCPVMTVRVHD